jgi:hypothetical protein
MEREDIEIGEKERLGEREEGNAVRKMGGERERESGEDQKNVER